MDPAVLAERRAARAEQAEQSASRRAADAQVLAAQLARERARLEAERDAARAEAAAAREGADAAIAEARHLQAERDELRETLAQARRADDAAPASGDEAPAAGSAGDAVATGGAGRNGGATAPPAAWGRLLRRELAVARGVAAATAGPAGTDAPLDPVAGLAGERRLVARRASAAPAASPAPAPQARRGDRAAPITALTLERERSSRLQAQLDHSLAVQQELRTQLAALERAVRERVEAERRIEAALRRVREELTAANAFAASRAAPEDAAPRHPDPPAGLGSPPRAAAGTAAPSASPSRPAADPPSAPEPAARAAAEPPSAAAPPSATGPAEQPSADPPRAADPPAAPVASDPPAAPPPAEAAPRLELVADAPAAAVAPPAMAGLDPLRLSAARERLRAATPVVPPLAELPAGPVAPWLTTALRKLLASEPETAGRIALGVLPAQALPAERALRYDVQLDGHATVVVDVAPGAAQVHPRSAPRERKATDLRIAADHEGFARLLYGPWRLRRPARVRGSRKALRELRRLARAPYGIRDLADTGVTLDPALALRLVALALDPAATSGERFAIAHAPLAGGPVDAWLRIADGEPPSVVTAAPPEPVRMTFRCTRGALLALIAGVAPPPGETGTVDGDDAALALLRGWIAATEHPAA